MWNDFETAAVRYHSILCWMCEKRNFRLLDEYVALNYLTCSGLLLLQYFADNLNIQWN